MTVEVRKHSPLELQTYLSTTKTRVGEMITKAEPYSFQEYLGYACNQALSSLEQGNHGTGAIYVLRKDGQEILFAGKNQRFSKRDSHLHAEQDAIDTVERYSRGEEISSEKILMVRNAPHNNYERILVSTLEPCLMCLGRILVHNVDTLFVGAKDIDGGAVFNQEVGLPRIWKIRKDCLNIVSPDFNNTQSPNYIGPKFISLSKDIFDTYRSALTTEWNKPGGVQEKIAPVSKCYEGSL